MTLLHCSPESKAQLAISEPRNDEVIFSEAIFDQVVIAGMPSIAYGDGALINDALRRWHGKTPAPHHLWPGMRECRTGGATLIAVLGSDRSNTLFTARPLGTSCSRSVSTRDAMSCSV